MKYQTKGQVEIMGLLIIIILITITLILGLRLIGAENDVEYKNEFMQSQLASNMLSSLLKSTSRDCSGFFYDRNFAGLQPESRYNMRR